MTYLFCLPLIYGARCNVQYDQCSDDSTRGIIKRSEGNGHCSSTCRNLEQSTKGIIGDCTYINTMVIAFAICLKNIFHKLGLTGGLSLFGPHFCRSCSTSVVDKPRIT